MSLLDSLIFLTPKYTPMRPNKVHDISMILACQMESNVILLFSVVAYKSRLRFRDSLVSLPFPLVVAHVIASAAQPCYALAQVMPSVY